MKGKRIKMGRDESGRMVKNRKRRKLWEGETRLL